MASTDETDVVVIGSGAGGAPVAAILAEAGADVVVLEKGPYYTNRDFLHDEVKICRRDFWVPYISTDPHTIRRGKQTRATRTRDGWTSRCVGGATVHMSGFFYRLKEQDLKLATLTGGVKGSDIEDWPITIEDLMPFYDLMEARIGVSGRAGINPFETRTKPFPLPPLQPHPAAQSLDVAARELKFHPFPTPRAIVSRPYGRRPPCNYAGLCGDYGCENSSKSSTLVTFIPDAEATGHCQIRSNSRATRIITNALDKVEGVEYIDEHDKTHLIKARVVCVAASAIESARLLLLSRNARFPNGLANNNGLVGRNLTFSAFGKGTAIFDRADLIAAFGKENMDLPFMLRSIQDDYWNEKAGFAIPKGGTYNFLIHHPNIINAAIRLVMDSKWELMGQALKDRLRRYFQDELIIEFEIFGEHLPWQGCYTDLDPYIKDDHGFPAARITLQNHPITDDVNRAMTSRGLEVLKAMKPAAKKVYPWTWASTTMHLQQGTCRFGKDPDKSVLDPSCQAHEVKNLYVTDGSFMPTSGAVPSTPTIMANSLRVAYAIRERFLKREI
ncbi:MAG: GMC family oxidoreductase [Deltaproteobacteria bacterium]|nr:GMC family oxidoreductase [Deltaproteobacteria bacterium]